MHVAAEALGDIRWDAMNPDEEVEAVETLAEESE